VEPILRELNPVHTHISLIKYHFEYYHSTMNMCPKGNFITLILFSKATPVTSHEGPSGCETSRLPHFLDKQLIDGGKVVSLTRRPLFTPPGRFLVLISVRGWVNPRAIVWLEGLGKLKKIHLIGTRTRNLPACSTVPRPTTLPRAPILFSNYKLWSSWCNIRQPPISCNLVLSIRLNTLQPK
jgi:hypothetical protein